MVEGKFTFVKDRSELIFVSGIRNDIASVGAAVRQMDLENISAVRD